MAKIKTILELVGMILVLCVLCFYVAIMAAGIFGPDTKILLDPLPVSTNTHDHRIDRWSNIDLA